jgi:hypothetical protein
MRKEVIPRERRENLNNEEEIRRPRQMMKALIKPKKQGVRNVEKHIKRRSVIGSLVVVLDVVKRDTGSAIVPTKTWQVPLTKGRA